MYCKNCGANNTDGSKFCSNCAQPLEQNNMQETQKLVQNKSLYSAHLLNIISAATIIISLIFLGYADSQSLGHSDSSEFFANFSCLLDFIVVIIGLFLYYNKKIINKKNLALTYMVLALVITGLLFYGSIQSISFTCGLGFVSIVSGILQIIAGVKFLAVYKYEQ